MVPGLQSNVRLDANQQVAASTTLVDLGTGAFAFSFNLPANKTIVGRAWLPFLVGATGGFKFLLTSSQTPQDYTAGWEAIDGITASPGAQVALVQTSEAAFANAWAVAGNHEVNLDFSLKGHATLNSTVKVQFACNSAANAISILKGAWMQITQIY